MALTALDPDALFNVYLSDDEARESPFQCRVLPLAVSTRLHNMMADALTLGGKSKQGDIVVMALKEGLRGWPLVDSVGEPVELEVDAKGCPTDRSLERMRPSWRTEVMEAIMTANAMDDDDRKN